MEFVSRMKTLLSQDYALYEKAMDEEPVRALRVNTDKISVADFKSVCPFEIEPIPYVPNGFYFQQEKVHEGRKGFGSGYFCARTLYRYP